MEGLIAAAQESVACTAASALGATGARAECCKLARYCTKLGGLLGELGLCLASYEALRGSKSVFLAVDATVSALRQAEQLVTQCAGTQPSSIWPLEDAVEFEAVSAELRSAAAGLAALGSRLPQDVQEDAAHVYRQFAGLSFTESELKETEEQELEKVQHSNSFSPRHPAAVKTTASAAAPAAEPAPSAAAIAPPAAPPEQFDRPQEAVENAAVARSQVAAAIARAPVPVLAAAAAARPAAADDAEQRRELQSAAAVAVTAVAEVLADAEEEGQEGPGGGEAGERAAAGDRAEAAAGAIREEEAEALRREIEEEAAEAAPGGLRDVVLTPEGETAMSPTARAKGAVPARGSSPLPRDPFEMTGPDSDLGMNTLRELKTFQRGQHDLAVADEAQIEIEQIEIQAQRQLEASADNLSLRDQQRATSGGGGEAGTQAALAALQQLADYEAAMGAGEEAEEAGDLEAGLESPGSSMPASASSTGSAAGAAGATAAAGAAAAGGNGSDGSGEGGKEGEEGGEEAHMHKSRSEAAAVAMARNLDELAGTPAGTEE